MYNERVQPEIHHGRRDLWLPGLVVVVGWGLSLATWWLLVLDRRESVLHWSAELADETERLAARGVESYLAALDGLALSWARIGPGSVEGWQADVGRLRGNFPAVDFVAWADRDGEGLRVSSGGAQPAPAELRSLRREPGASFGPILRGPDPDANGASSVDLRLPVGPDGASGLLLARVDLPTLLREVLAGVALGFALEVRWDDVEIFARGQPSSDPWQEWWRSERRVELPHGVVWRILQRPTAELAAVQLTPTPHYLLASGLVLWLVVAGLAHQVRLTRRQARFLAASNRALEERGDELEGRVAERTRELEDAVGELRSFNQMVAHDLRSPLGAVLNLVSILEEDYRGRTLDAEGVDLLARIRSSASRTGELLDGLLHLSRAGRAALEIRPIDVRDLVEEIFAQVRIAESDSDVEFVVEDLPAIEGDRTLLGDVFSNLFTNALRYSRGREKRRIEVRGVAEGARCVYEVADNGRGFDMRFQDKLFAVFERLDPDDGVGGTGVGLAVVARVVRRHGGRVWAEGRPGEGARFFLELPRRAEVGS